MRIPSLEIRPNADQSISARRWSRFWLLLAVLLPAAVGLAAIMIRAELAVWADARSTHRLLGLGNYREARVVLDRWLQKRPSSAEATFLLARSLLGLRDYDQGFPMLERAARLGYPIPRIERARAIALAWMGRYQEAEPTLRRLTQPSSIPDPEVDEALAKCFLETFQLIAADQVLDRWIRDAPDDARARYWKGEVGRKTSEDLPIVIQYFEAAVRLDPECDPARLALAELYLESHRLDDAVREYTLYLDRNSEAPDGFNGLAQVALEQGDLDSAVCHFDRALMLAPGDPKPLLERGKIEVRRGHLEAALGYLDRALAVDPKEPAIHYHRSLVLARLGRTAESAQEREQSARLREDKEQLDTLLRSLLNAPGDTALQLNAARWLFEHGHPEEGLRWAQKILGEHPHHAETSALLADYYQQQGNRGLANYYHLQAGSAAGSSAQRR
jgi:tetratricopeptide (TPR) repeat protein